jgi:hypothetical protein
LGLTHDHVADLEEPHIEDSTITDAAFTQSPPQGPAAVERGDFQLMVSGRPGVRNEHLVLFVTVKVVDG